ncbi:prepilin peptidase [Paenibacillus sonchi]|uniref:Prepilin peptidase n=1 Tax=Paenibacillus sonchi TaxID=373687 RepID=A0A974SB44_9BACL|nr:prepilin peptidase [Paenibacillus sonchi]QQZ58914.1 prepilin peptidase [Paenibacillus sonchi]
MEGWLIDLPLVLILIYATYTDLKKRVIPNRLVLVGLGYMLLARLFIADQGYGYYVLGTVAASSLMYLAALFIPGSIGGGDIKLLTVVGAAMGWWKSLVFLWLLLGLAGVFAVIGMLIWRSGKLKIPIAPFFLAANILIFMYPIKLWI